MRSLIFITQAADPAHPVLGATLPKIRALAERVDEVVVLADSIDPDGAAGELPRAQLCRARRRPSAERAASLR